MTIAEELDLLHRERARQLTALGPRPPWWRPFARRSWSAAIQRILSVTLDETTLLLRRQYPVSAITDLAARPSPALSMIRKPYTRPVEYKDGKLLPFVGKAD